MKTTPNIKNSAIVKNTVQLEISTRLNFHKYHYMASIAFHLALTFTNYGHLPVHYIAKIIFNYNSFSLVEY